MPGHMSWWSSCCVLSRGRRLTTRAPRLDAPLLLCTGVRWKADALGPDVDRAIQQCSTIGVPPGSLASCWLIMPLIMAAKMSTVTGLCDPKVAEGLACQLQDSDRGCVRLGARHEARGSVR